ncbi:MAG: TonB-dependent receptor [Hyphomonadaceae bacterium]|nr:TonB-dependent receptor [Hyphomonadaceae bacterium]
MNKPQTQASFGGRSFLRSLLMIGGSTLALGAAVSPALAQDASQEEAIVVTGVRASLERSMDIKRSATGVVDAISAEDMGKFPDTNLAESLQRITGVSINRVNGEGSEVTVRGFGGGYNMVTLNGRAMPTANVNTIGQDQNGDFTSGTSRSFDFSNLASEGVNALEVFKTGRAAVPSGGIGATINVRTLRPLDNPGLRGTFGLKAQNDTSVETGDEVTPEASGLLSWTNDSNTFGVSLFGSYQKRDSATRSATVNGWNVDMSGAAFINPANGRVAPGAQITNSPAAAPFVSYPNDSRYHFSETERERINGMLTLQFRPSDALTVTADAFYAQNEQTEQRTDQTNWFARPFDRVTFDGNPQLASTLFLHETLGSPTKDMGFEQQYRATQDTIQSFGVNAEWRVTDNFTLTLDAATSKAESSPNAPNGTSSTLVAIATPVIAQHSVDFSTGVPVQRYSFNDSVKGNNNGRLDLGDLGTQQNRTAASSQEQDLDQIRIDAAWEFGGSGRLDFGVDYRKSQMHQRRVDTQQVLGDWGVNNPGDVQRFAPGLVEQFCLSCLFSDFSVGDASVAFRGNAVDLYRAFATAYASSPNNVTNREDNKVDEEILAAYAQFSMEGQFLGRDARMVAGVRYENTETTSTSVITPTSLIVWSADNDFNSRTASTSSPVSEDGSYSNVLPAFDFSMDITDDIVGRVSWSKTLARTDYANLFANTQVRNNSPNRPTFLGGVPTAQSGNPQLTPLVSDNFDVSLEWYYGDASFFSIGFYEKRVRDFVGVGQTTRNLFGLRDPSSGAAGTRSALALQTLATIPNAGVTDVNMFTMTALIDQFGATEARNRFLANSTNGVLTQTYVDQILGQFDVIANSTDPLFNFEVTQPVNVNDARIYGFEAAIQHFFGDSGFGVAASYTSVSGDIEFDVYANPSIDQFALVGLSDTYNVTAIYDKYGISARLTYNWRDTFLANNNRGDAFRSPVFTEPFGQLDFSASYELTPNWMISLEGLNLTEEHVRTYARQESNVWFAQELDSRYLLGVRYRMN